MGAAHPGARRGRTGRAARVTLAVAGAAVLGGCGSSFPGIPAQVTRVVGSDPIVLTVHGPLLGLLAAPEIEQLTTLEAKLTADHGIIAQYGPVRWLRARIASIAGQVAGRVNTKNSRAAELVRAGADGNLSLQNENLTSTLVLGSGERPVHGLGWLFPTGQTARIFIRVTSGVSRPAVTRHILAQAAGVLNDATVTVSGVS